MSRARMSHIMRINDQITLMRVFRLGEIRHTSLEDCVTDVLIRCWLNFMLFARLYLHVDTSAHWRDAMNPPRNVFSFHSSECLPMEFLEDDSVAQVQDNRFQLDVLNRLLEVLSTSIGTTLLHCNQVAVQQ